MFTQFHRQNPYTASNVCDHFHSPIHPIRHLDSEPEQLLPAYFKSRIHQLLQTLFGETGGHTTVDLLRFDASTRRAILRVPAVHYVKLRAALAFVPTFQEQPCCVKVLGASPVLLSLLNSA